MTTHSNLLSATNSLFCAVDIQTKLTRVMPETEAEQMITNTISLLTAANLLQIPVLLTKQYPKGLGNTDARIGENLPASAQIFDKTGFSCCLAEGFCKAVEHSGRNQVILVGQEAHVCILQTALELQQQGYRVYVLEDTLCSRKPEHKFYALQRMQQQGITISNHESVLFEWLRDSNHPDFKQISGLLT